MYIRKRKEAALRNFGMELVVKREHEVEFKEVVVEIDIMKW